MDKKPFQTRKFRNIHTRLNYFQKYPESRFIISHGAHPDIEKVTRLVKAQKLAPYTKETLTLPYKT